MDNLKNLSEQLAKAYKAWQDTKLAHKYRVRAKVQEVIEKSDNKRLSLEKIETALSIEYGWDKYERHIIELESEYLELKFYIKLITSDFTQHTKEG